MRERLAERIVAKVGVSATTTFVTCDTPHRTNHIIVAYKQTGQSLLYCLQDHRQTMFSMSAQHVI